MEDYSENLSLSNNVKRIILGLVISTISTMIFIFLLSIILYYSNLSEMVVDNFIIFISAFSILIGSFFSLKQINKNGLMYGSIFGIIYMIIIYLLSSIVSNDFSIEKESIIMIIFGLVSGGVGGILGVNLKL